MQFLDISPVHGELIPVGIRWRRTALVPACFLLLLSAVEPVVVAEYSQQVVMSFVEQIVFVHVLVVLLQVSELAFVLPQGALLLLLSFDFSRAVLLSLQELEPLLRIQD